MLSSRAFLGLLVLCALAGLTSVGASAVAIHTDALLLSPATLSPGAIYPGASTQDPNSAAPEAPLQGGADGGASSMDAGASGKYGDAASANAGGNSTTSGDDVGPEVIIPKMLSRITSYHLLNNLGLVHPDCRVTPTTLACTLDLPYAIFTDEFTLLLDVMQKKGLPEMASARDESPDVEGGYVVGFGLGCGEPDGQSKLTDNGAEAQGMAGAMGGRDCVRVVVRERVSAAGGAASAGPGSSSTKGGAAGFGASASAAGAGADGAADPTAGAASAGTGADGTTPSTDGATPSADAATPSAGAGAGAATPSADAASPGGAAASPASSTAGAASG